MSIQANTPEEYILQTDSDKRQALILLRETIIKALPEGFEEQILYNMISYVVPKTLYPKGYHVDKSIPLPFISIAAQKNFIALYHLGIYANKAISDWFIAEYKHVSGKKPDMGKSCIRFKKPNEIPFKLIAELVSKISVDQWIIIYEENFHKKNPVL